MKNDTRISSLLGTWTGETHLKTSIGSYELSAYFVIHFMPDPTREYSCALPNCSEYENHVCHWNKSGKPKECVDLSVTSKDELLDWGDVNAFVFFGAKVDVGFPFNKHREEDTGGWIGPMNIIMAQDPVVHDQKADEKSTLVDRYVSRYVATQITSLIHMPENCTLVDANDFDLIVGKDAVLNTVHGQYNPSNDDEDKDPYEKYKETCVNGDVKPMLPLFHFDFIQDPETGEETINVQLKYKLMTIPNKKDYMYDIYPQIQQKFNHLNTGFQISGPYCYGNDPNRGYSFDMNFDSKDPKDMIKVRHGCVEGLPCFPKAANLYTDSMNSVPITPLPDDATTISLSPILFFVSTILTFAFITMGLLCQNRTLKNKIRNFELSAMDDNHEATTPYIQLDYVDNLDIDQQEASVSEEEPLVVQL